MVYLLKKRKMWVQGRSVTQIVSGLEKAKKTKLGTFF